MASKKGSMNMNKVGVPKLEVKSDKFTDTVFDLIRTGVAPRIGGNINLGVKLTAEHFKSNGVASLSSITVDALTNAMDAIVGAVPTPSVKKEESDNIHDYLDAAADDKFAHGEWEGRVKVFHLVGFLRAKGYGPKNLAGPEVIGGFIAANTERDEKVKELEERKPEDGFGPRPCERPTHRGANPPIQPTKRYKVRWEDHQPIGRLTYEGGGEMIVAGDVLMNKDAAWKILSDLDADTLAKVDLLVVAKDSYRFYCPACQHAASEAMPYPKLIFRTFGGVLNVLEAMRLKIVGRTSTASFEAGAAASSKPRGFDGSRPGSRKTQNWGHNRSHEQ